MKTKNPVVKEVSDVIQPYKSIWVKLLNGIICGTKKGNFTKWG